MKIPDGFKLFVVSPANGIVSAIDLSGMDLDKIIARASLVEDVIAAVADDIMNTLPEEK